MAGRRSTTRTRTVFGSKRSTRADSNPWTERPLETARQVLQTGGVDRAIHVLPDEVTVTYQSGGSYHTISSAFAVLAIPLTTARQIEKMICSREIELKLVFRFMPKRLFIIEFDEGRYCPPST